MKDGVGKTACKRVIRKVTQITSLHILRLVYRSLLFLGATALYIFDRTGLLSTAVGRIGVAVIWCVFILEMVLRFFPSTLESMGCQKQFKRNFMPRGGVSAECEKSDPKPVLTVAASWLALNAITAALYFTGVIDSGMLILISLFYSVCDMVCILFFCPFQSWIMKNRCCVSCRIYNWDYAMMFTPLLLVPTFVTWSLAAVALALLTRWELTAHLHPERFSERTNEHLDCINCREKLCRHKKQIQKLLAKLHIHESHQND